MPANKMPEMPKVVATDVVNDASWNLCDLDDAVDYGRACYLAGIADAKACVPEALNIFSDPRAITGFESCQQQILTNLTALEQEAKR